MDFDYSPPCQLPKCSCGCSCCFPCKPFLCSGKYVLTSKLSEKLEIMPLPLAKVRHITTTATTAVKAEAKVYSKSSICTDFLPCVCVPMHAELVY